MSTAAERVEAWDRARRNAAGWADDEFNGRLRLGDDRSEAIRTMGYLCGFYRDWAHRTAIINAMNLTDPTEISTLEAGYEDYKKERAEYVAKYGYEK